MVNVNELTDQDINFLKTLKDRGVSKNEAFSRLETVKAESQAGPVLKKRAEKLGVSLPDAVSGDLEPGKAKRKLRRAQKTDEAIEKYGKVGGRITRVPVVGGIVEAVPETAEAIRTANIRKERARAELMAEEGFTEKEAKGFIPKKTPIGIGAKFIEKVGENVLGEDIVEPAFRTITTEGGRERLGERFAESGFVDIFQSAQEQFNKLDPVTRENLQDLSSLFGAGAELFGAGAGKEPAEQVIKQTVKAGREGLEQAATKAVVQTAGNAAKKVAGGTLETAANTGVDLVAKLVDPEQTLQNLNRITKKEVRDFAKLNEGKTPSQWMIERDIIAAPEETAEILINRADEAKNLLDQGIEQIDAVYTDPRLEIPLQDLKSKFEKTKPFGGQEVTDVIDYANKLESGEGLTLSEVNNLKRIYEKNVKVNYLRENNADGIARANDVDSMLRNFIRDEAEAAGFPVVKRLSNEIQSSYTIANTIGDWLKGSKTNNPISLSDTILIGGSIADLKTGGLLTGLKFALSKAGVRAKFVKAATRGAIKDLKELPGVPEEIINIKNAERRAFEFQRWASENGLYRFTGEPEPKLLPEGKTIEAPKASPEALAEMYREGKL